MSKRTSERSGARERSHRTSERCERTAERMSEWNITKRLVSRGPESLCPVQIGAVCLLFLCPINLFSLVFLSVEVCQAHVDEGLFIRRSIYRWYLRKKSMGPLCPNVQ